jgi:hypothetical protein
MLLLIAFVGAAIIALVLWKAMNASRSDTPSLPTPPTRPQRPAGPGRPRVSGPDDDAEFLRKLGERVKRRDEPPAG